jgi:hypothetical protein
MAACPFVLEHRNDGEVVNVVHRGDPDGDGDQRHRLMRGSEQHRHVVDERQHPEQVLRCDERQQGDAEAVGRPVGSDTPHPQDEEDDCDQEDGSKHAMHPLHGAGVLNEVEDRRVQRQPPGGHETPRDQREGAEEQASLHACHERAPHDLYRQQRADDRQAAAERAPGAGRRRRARRADRKVASEPDRGSDDGDGEGEMKGEPVMADARPIDQPALDHQPAHGALQRAEREEREPTRGERPREIPCPPEQNEGNQEHRADRPRAEPMEVFPEEDLLELAERHAAPQLLVLRELPVAIEQLSPLRLVEGRHDAHQRPPVDDREAGMRQPRDAADHDDGKGDCGDAPEPEPQAPPLRFRDLLAPVLRRRVAARHLFLTAPYSARTAAAIASAPPVTT